MMAGPWWATCSKSRASPNRSCRAGGSASSRLRRQTSWARSGGRPTATGREAARRSHAVGDVLVTSAGRARSDECSAPGGRGRRGRVPNRVSRHGGHNHHSASATGWRVGSPGNIARQRPHWREAIVSSLPAGRVGSPITNKGSALAEATDRPHLEQPEHEHGDDDDDGSHDEHRGAPSCTRARSRRRRLRPGRYGLRVQLKRKTSKLILVLLYACWR